MSVKYEKQDCDILLFRQYIASMGIDNLEAKEIMNMANVHQITIEVVA